MAVRTAEAEWTGNLKEGAGSVSTESGTLQGAYSFRSRFQDGDGTNPEELIGAAHAGCFSMAFANILDQEGHDPARVHTTAKVTLGTGDGGPAITGIVLVCEAEVPGIDEPTFQDLAEKAKEGCPVSKALAAMSITLEASLAG